MAVAGAHRAVRRGRGRRCGTSTHAAASSAVAPRPSTLTVMEGSAPASRANRMNSSVPKSLGSGSFFHDRLIQVGRLVARTDTPLPVIVLGDIAARPADERGPSAFTLSNVGAYAVDCVAGHERHLVDPDRALPGEQDSEARERIGGAALSVNTCCFHSPATLAMPRPHRWRQARDRSRSASSATRNVAVERVRLDPDDPR